MEIVIWAVLGIVAGLIARALVPGNDPMGLLGTMILGLVGSLIGGFLITLFASGDGDITPAGLIGSVIGAIVALMLWRTVGSRGGARTI